MSAYFVVQSFGKSQRGALRPDVPLQAQSTVHARRLAERLSERKELVIAFMREGDPVIGEFEDAKVIAAFGDIPEEISSMPRV